MNISKIIMFGCYLTGHGIETVSQMLDDWENSPSALMSESKAENLPISGVRLSLPDNDEIEKESECLIAKYQKVNDTLGLGFRAGAKWMRDEIVNRNGSEA